jgi:hypothetical protein
MFMCAGLFSAKPAFANPPDAHQQAMEIHNQHHQQAHQQAMEASRRAAEGHRRFVEENQRRQNGWQGEFNGRQIRRMSQARRYYYYVHYNETDLFKRLREWREARREARQSQAE